MCPICGKPRKWTHECSPSSSPPAATEHTFTVTVSGCSRDEALQVMTERINFEEDYGFEYDLDFR